MSNFSYRKAEKPDLKALFDLAVEFSNYSVGKSNDYEEFFGGAGNWEQDFREEIEESLDDSNSMILLAMENEVPVGYIIAIYSPKHYYYVIDELYIKESHWGKNVGTTLLQKALEWGKQFNCPIRVEVYNWNKKAINFYLKNGFKETTTILEIK